MQYERVEQPKTREAISELVLGADFIEIAGAQSHGKLSPGRENVVLADLSAYRGITEYEPQEYVISARCGTPVREISLELEAHNQYLPFDPPEGTPEATLGGAVAAGWSGPGSLRYGRLRDFILGVDLVPGTGRWIKGGGKVVKNAAGFDLPKLVVGSLGCFGIIGHVTLKVFPSPVSTLTITGEFKDFESGFEGLGKMLVSGMTLDGCVLESGGRLNVRLGGLKASFPRRVDKVRECMEGAAIEFLEGIDEDRFWQSIRNTGLGIEAGGRCKIPIRPSEVREWQAHLADKPYRYFYDQAGAVLIIDLSNDKGLEELRGHLEKIGRSALCIGFPGGPKWMGTMPDLLFLNRIRNALDPEGKFPNLEERFFA